MRVWRTKVVDIASPRRRHPGLDRNFLLPGFPGAPSRSLRPRPARLSGVHPVLDRLVRPGPALGRQCAGLREFAAHRFPLGLFPGRSANLHPVVRGRGGHCYFGGAAPIAAGFVRSAPFRNCTNRGAKLLRVPQIDVPFGLHQRLWPIKYIIFLVLFGLSLYSLSLGEEASEVEPFKTAIILHFVRDWPFVLYAAALLVAGLFIERFFCRYLCPLGAALAIPARIRMFDWLRRYQECGNPCRRCANECPVQCNPSGRTYQPQRMHTVHALPNALSSRSEMPGHDPRRLKREKTHGDGSASMRRRGRAPRRYRWPYTRRGRKGSTIVATTPRRIGRLHGHRLQNSARGPISHRLR